MADAVPGIQRSALHQWPADPPMLRALAARMPGQIRESPYMERPNLLVHTGTVCTPDCPDDCADHHGLTLPALSLREG